MSPSSHRALLHKNPELLPKHVFLHHEIADRLVTYLNDNPYFIPETVLEIGAQDDYLQKAFNGVYAKAHYTIEKNEATTNHPVDLILSNLYLQDSLNIETTIDIIKNSLKPKGKFFLSSIAFDSFSNCLTVDGPEFNEYPEIKRLADYLHTQGFVDVIAHLEKINLQYDSLDTLLQDIRVMGAYPHNPLFKGLRTSRWLANWKEKMNKHCHDGIYEIPVNILYVHAQMSALQSAKLNQNNEAYFGIDQLLSTRTKKD